MIRLTAKVYNIQGEEVGTTKLPAEIFNVEMNKDLIYQAIAIQRANSRIHYAHTKDRSEVRGGGRKPWRQKGTGRARHGSTRSPIWIGGGITFGPRKEKKFKKKINKKAKTKALFMVLSSKFIDKELIILDKLELKQEKTKSMAEILNKIFKKQKTKNKEQTESVLITTAKKDDKIIRAARNLSYVKTIAANSLNIIDILSFRYLLLDKDTIKIIEKTYAR